MFLVELYGRAIILQNVATTDALNVESTKVAREEYQKLSKREAGLLRIKARP